MKINELLHKVVLTLLVCGLFGFSPTALQAQQANMGNDFSAEVQAMTLADLQEMFYKVEIEDQINLDLENQSLGQALGRIASVTGLKLTYRGDIMSDKTVTLKRNNITVSDALDFILEGTGLDYMISSEGYLLINRPADTIAVDQGSETITGMVIDSRTGEALPLVSILVTGTTIGVASELDGSYELNVPSLQDTLRFSYIGYRELLVPIAGREVIDVQLVPSSVTGEEVVVTALGISRDTRSMGYSTSSVSPEDFSINRTGNFMDALQGQVAGVNITSMSSGPGGSSKVRIRGQSSFGGNNDPLIVVDGVPISNAGTYGGFNVDGGDGLGSINPDAVESMTLLKGAAASALYGSRAQDGVIMITTKRSAGTRGVGVTFNSNIQMSSAIDHTNYQYEYGQGEGGIRPTSSFPGNGVWSFGEKIEPGMTQTLFDGVVVPYEPQRDRIKTFFRDAYMVNNSINLSSGGADGGMNLSISQLDQESIVPNSSFERYNINFGFTQDVAAGLNVSGNINYVKEKNNMPVLMNDQDLTVPTVVYTLANTMPLEVLRDNAYLENGDEAYWTRFRNRTNPYITIDPNARIANGARDRLYGNVQLRYELADWIYVQGRIGQDYYTNTQESNFPTGLAVSGPAPTGFVNGSYSQNVGRFREINADFLVGFDRQATESIGVSGTFGGNIMNRRNDSNNVNANDFVVRGLYTFGNARDVNGGYNYSETQVNSLYGALELNYNDFLYLNVTARNDWFSVLDPDERSILYPSISSSFVFSDVIDTPSWLDQGTLRAAYAEVGSSSGLGFASGNVTYGTNSNLYPARNGTMVSLGSLSGQLPVSGLKPMRVKEFEFGMNLMLFGRANLDLTYYDKRSVDQILGQSISSASGYGSKNFNVGESGNKGLEFLLSVAPIENQNFLWNVTLNGSYNTTHVYDVGDEVDLIEVGGGDWQTAGGTIRHVEGGSMGQIWVTGYLRDDNGNIIINQNNGIPINTSTPIYMGDGIPKYVGGITNSFNVGNLGFSFLVDFKLGHKLLSGLEHNLYRHGLDPRTLPGRDTGSFVVEGVTPDGAVNQVAANVYSLYGSYGSNRENFIHNAGFWKLRQATLSYNLTSLVTDFLPVRGATLSLVGNNLLILKKWTPQHDPEQVSYTSDNNVGFSGAALPMTRNIGFNLRVEI